MKNIFLAACVITQLVAVPAQEIFDNLMSHQEVRLFGHASVSSLAFSDDGSLLAAGSSSGAMRIYDCKKDAIVQKMSDTWWPITAVGFTPDNQHLFSCSGERISEWDVGRRSYAKRFINLFERGHEALSRNWGPAFLGFNITSFAFNEGRRLASFFYNYKHGVYDLQTQSEIKMSRESHMVHLNALSPDGKKEAYIINDYGEVGGEVMIRHLPNLKPVSLCLSSEKIEAMAFDEKGKMLALLSSIPELKGSHVTVWDTTDKTQVISFKQLELLRSIALHSGSDQLVGGLEHGGRVLIWNLADTKFAQDCFIDQGGVTRFEKNMSLQRLALLQLIYQHKKPNESVRDALRKIREKNIISPVGLTCAI